MPFLFSEAEYEDAIIELYQQMGYDYVYGPNVVRDYTDPLYQDVLTSSIENINRDLPSAAVQEALRKIQNMENGTVVRKNNVFMDYLQNGVPVRYFHKVDVDIYKNRLLDAIRGNFPGAEWSEEGMSTLPCLKNEKAYSVSTASNIPTEKSEKFISQTIEKLLDGIIPDNNKKEYTIILLATPIRDVEERKLKLGEFYSGLAPYASWQQQFQHTENKALGSAATVGVNVGASAGVQNGQNFSTTGSNSVTDSSAHTDTVTDSETLSEGTSDSLSSSTAHTDGTNSATQTSEGSSDTTGGQVGVNFLVSGGGNYSHGWTRGTSESLGKMASDTITKGLTNTVSKTVAKTTGTAVANTLGKAVTKAMANTAGASRGASLGANFGANFARSSTVTAMIGMNEGITQTFTNYNIKHALELLETQMKRLEQSTALGMWDFAAYVLSEDHNTANNVAHSYLALTLGEGSYMSKSAINLWRGNVDEERDIAKEICAYLEHFHIVS